ncbi:hypothetical protein K2173_019725 [Erythroxylum novogranatense]|uniref:WRKY domain-containing protein n=1 Tax=Erythroxylum novogranatense TaxID=1862640 RepID=A0AAV8SM50_9ROSI|nr:hypothetical protein K2173_019725 [Erythroxylum novogranatense]
MEGRSGPEEVAKEDKGADFYVGQEGGCREDTIANKLAAKPDPEDRASMGPDSNEPSSGQKEQDIKLECARAEMGEVREENQRLKTYLNQIMKDYQTLQMQFYDIVHQEEANKSTETKNNHQATDQDTELVSLTLGFPSDTKNNAKPSSSGKHDDQVTKKGLSLGLDCKFESDTISDEKPSPAVNSFEEPNEESEETRMPNKGSKTARSEDDEVLQQSPVKKVRVSLKARCDTPTMNDGCQWRKYGQKIAKGNPCPRAYYRCTVGPTCPVRKQVQRCADDMSILITTYEGTHNHPLPVSATAMASTTSAAASMLLSGSSSSSGPNSLSSTSINTKNFVDLHGLKFYLSDNSKLKPFYIQSNPSLSSSSSHQTITLDLTSTPSSSSPFTRFSSTYSPLSQFSSTSLNFSSSESNATMPLSNMFFGYNCGSQPYQRNPFRTLNLERIVADNNNVYQSYIQKSHPTRPLQQSLSDTITAATKAITADPSFQSALAAALTSIIGTSSDGNSFTAAIGSGNQGSIDNFSQKLKWGGNFPVASSYSATSKVNACATSYLNKTTSSTNPHQSENLVFLPSPLPYSAPKGAPTSSGDNRDQAT